jgi:hypothetical protein
MNSGFRDLRKEPKDVTVTNDLRLGQRKHCFLFVLRADI